MTLGRLYVFPYLFILCVLNVNQSFFFVAISLQSATDQKHNLDPLKADILLRIDNVEDKREMRHNSKIVVYTGRYYMYKGQQRMKKFTRACSRFLLIQGLWPCALRSFSG